MKNTFWSSVSVLVGADGFSSVFGFSVGFGEGSVSKRGFYDVSVYLSSFDSKRLQQYLFY